METLRCFGILMSGGTTSSTVPIAGLSDATLYIADSYVPTLAPVQHSGYTPAQWVSDATDTVTVDSSVPSGLGIKETALGGQLPVQKVSNNNCDGFFVACPLTQHAQLTLQHRKPARGDDLGSGAGYRLGRKRLQPRRTGRDMGHQHRPHCTEHDHVRVALGCPEPRLRLRRSQPNRERERRQRRWERDFRRCLHPHLCRWPAGKAPCPKVPKAAQTAGAP